MGRLLRIERFRWQGQNFETWLLQRDSGGCTAKTKLGYKDCIVTDGEVEKDVLREHWRVLPVAVWARGLWD